MESGLPLGTERREDITQIDGILGGVPVEVGASRKPGRGYPVDHGPVAQHGEVEAVAVGVIDSSGFGWALLGQHAGGVLSFRYAPRHGRGV